MGAGGSALRTLGGIDQRRTVEPMAVLPEWPGNDEAKAHDFKAGFEQDENGTIQKFTEPEPVDGVGQLHHE